MSSRDFCAFSTSIARNPSEIRVATALHRVAAMDPDEFDRLVARAHDPRLIPGIYNYCDGRCPRCAFTSRCLTFLDNREVNAAGAAHDLSVAEIVGASLQRTVDMLAEIARREGIDLVALAAEGAGDDADAPFERHEHDPLVVQAREYGELAWRIGRALEPVVAARGDRQTIDAVDTILWFSSHVAPKLYRAVCGAAEGWESDEDVQTDCNGSAKIALIGMRESRAGWIVLMETGNADGVPAQAVRTLDALDAAVRARFPRAEAFVRPGFDEPEVAAGGLAPRPQPPARSGSIAP